MPRKIGIGGRYADPGEGKQKDQRSCLVWRIDRDHRGVAGARANPGGMRGHPVDASLKRGVVDDGAVGSDDRGCRWFQPRQPPDRLSDVQLTPPAAVPPRGVEKLYTAVRRRRR
jgi:hypothetical protein